MQHKILFILFYFIITSFSFNTPYYCGNTGERIKFLNKYQMELYYYNYETGYMFYCIGNYKIINNRILFTISKINNRGEKIYFNKLKQNDSIYIIRRIMKINNKYKHNDKLIFDLISDDIFLKFTKFKVCDTFFQEYNISDTINDYN